MSQNKKIGVTIITGLLMIIAILFDWQIKPDRVASTQIENGVKNRVESTTEEKLVEVIFLDVGQGDSILIKTPEEQQIIIDGGDNDMVLEKLSEEMPLFDKTIELMILTHPHADHVAGLKSVLKRYKVNEIWLTGVVSTAPEYMEWLNLIKENKIPTKNIWACGKINLAGCTDEVEFEDNLIFKILNPLTNLAGQKVDNLNNSSIVVKLTFGENSWMLTGDLEEKQETMVLTNFNEGSLKAQILKAGHHGSKTSSGENWLKAVNPKQAIISVGADNTFGHPSLRILRRLERDNVEIWRTDEDGDITTIGDGKEIEIFSEQ